MMKLNWLQFFSSLLIVSTIFFFFFSSVSRSSLPIHFYTTVETNFYHPLGRVNDDLNNLKPQEIIDYFYWSNASSCQLAHEMWKDPSGLDGQKAVCLDPQVRPPPGDCIIYSFGISNEWSFDEAMEAYGCRVFAFDPSMGKGNHNHSRNIQFFNIGLSDRDYTTEKGWQMKTLSSIYKLLVPFHGERIIDYLKIDIESAEWDVLPQLIPSGMFAKVRQLGVEFHLDNRGDTLEKIIWRVKAIKFIEDAGMIRFDSKYNMWAKRQITVLDLYEAPFCFEIAFYQYLPSSTPFNPVYTFSKH